MNVITRGWGCLRSESIWLRSLHRNKKSWFFHEVNFLNGSQCSSKRLFSERVAQNVRNGKASSLDRSKVLRNYAAAFGSLAALVSSITGLYALRNSSEKEKRLNKEISENRNFLEAAKKLGLVDVREYASITTQQQADCYEEAKLELYIIGVSGARIFDDKKGTYNPIPKTIQILLERGVRVRLMIYDPDIEELHTDRSESEIRIEKIKKTILQAKHLEEQFPNRFELRVLIAVPPFHGNMIDTTRADITPIRRKGLGFTRGANTETYIESGTRIADIKSDFETIWEGSKLPK